jgi:hypothetical protein
VSAKVSEQDNRARELALELVSRAAPRAPEALQEAAARMEAHGPGKKDNPFGGQMICSGGPFVLAIGQAHEALSRGATVSAAAEKALRAFGFSPHLNRALGALDPDTRDAWLLRRELDDGDQPSEAFPGGWPFWVHWPSPRMTERVLARAAKWAPNDRWGTKRSVYADPMLRKYAEALRAQGNEADAKRCEALIPR